MPNVDAFKFDEMKQRIFEQLDSYSGIPFTMQVTGLTKLQQSILSGLTPSLPEAV